MAQVWLNLEGSFWGLTLVYWVYWVYLSDMFLLSYFFCIWVFWCTYTFTLWNRKNNAYCICNELSCKNSIQSQSTKKLRNIFLCIFAKVSKVRKNARRFLIVFTICFFHRARFPENFVIRNFHRWADTDRISLFKSQDRSGRSGQTFLRSHSLNFFAAAPLDQDQPFII